MRSADCAEASTRRQVKTMDVPWWKDLVVPEEWDKEWANDRRWS